MKPYKRILFSLILLVLTYSIFVDQTEAQNSFSEPVATFSIVAFDPGSGESVLRLHPAFLPLARSFPGRERTLAPWQLNRSQTRHSVGRDWN